MLLLFCFLLLQLHDSFLIGIRTKLMSASLITQGTNLLDIRYRNRMLVFSVEDEEKQQDLLEQELPISHEQVNISEVSHLNNSALESNNSVNNSLALAIQNLESKLSSDLIAAKSLLQKEKSALYSLQEKNFESGKNGYFLIQAQVKDFNVCFILNFLCFTIAVHLIFYY